MKMSNWNTTKIEKEVIEGHTITLQFEYLGNKLIRNTDPHCGCTSYKWDGNTLIINVKVDLVSQVLGKVIYQTKKDYIKNTSIDVYYTDGTQDNLKIELLVKEINHG